MKKFKIASTLVAGAMFLSVAGNVLAAEYADVLFVVDESGSMGGEHAWLTNMVTDLEAGLLGAGVGTTTSNQYGLIGYGASSFGSHDPAGSDPHKHTVGSGEFGSAADLSTATGSLVATGGTEDGWEAINFGLTNYSFRTGSAINVVLVTDEDRDNTSSDTYASILNALQGKNALLNVVVDVDLKDATGSTALGVDDAGNAYKADGSGGFTASAGGVATGGSGSTIADYVDLAWASGGAAWDLNQLRAGGNTATSFTAAFVDIKVTEITQQPGGEVPEPATMLLFGTGLAGLAGVSRRRKMKS